MQFFVDYLQPSLIGSVSQPAACSPYRYQSRLAEQGQPDVLRVPTGTGKTLAAALPWLYPALRIRTRKFGRRRRAGW